MEISQLEALRRDETIHIQMLGKFSVTQGALSISDSSNRTHQLWNLLEYLIAFRNKTISQEELIHTMWPDDDSENPANALKNLVYRIRTTFSKYGFPFSKEMILFHRGSYCWNNALPCVIDTEQYEKYIELANAETQDTERKIGLYKRALSLYEGDLLPGSCYEEWVITLSAYYRSLYFRCVYSAFELLMERSRFDEARQICEKAILIDPFEERAHKYLIYALIRQNRQSAALEHYNRVTDLFYRELGVKPSDSMRSLYREITKSVNSVETDLNVIREDLRERSLTEGAFYCDYEVFKNMYRVEARAASRNGLSVFIGLITVTGTDGTIPEPKQLSRVMDHLLEAIRASLRKGDVVSRFSSTQYVLMLPTLTFENGQMVLDRICKRFRYDFRMKNVQVHTTLQPLSPVED